MIIIGSDHAGFKLKQHIKKLLDSLNLKYKDVGGFCKDCADDYPDYAKKVARQVKNNNKGILICGSGIGVCIAANRVRGIRAVNAPNSKLAKFSREHNNSNILCLGGRILSPRKAKKITKIWLSTEFSKQPRHVRRIKKIEGR